MDNANVLRVSKEETVHRLILQRSVVATVIISKADVSVILNGKDRSVKQFGMNVNIQLVLAMVIASRGNVFASRDTRGKTVATWSVWRIVRRTAFVNETDFADASKVGMDWIARDEN